MKYPPIIVADDDPDAVLLLELAFQKLSIPNPIIVASDGQNAIGFLQRFLEAGSAPGFLLLDLNMPGKNGLDVLAWLRDQAELALLPAAILSSSRTAPELAAALGLGAMEYYLKPCSFAGLIQIARDIQHRFLLPLGPIPEQDGGAADQPKVQTQ